MIIIAANGFLHPLAIRMDRTRFSAGRENPPAEYVFEVICDDDSEIAIKSQIVGAVTRPGVSAEVTAILRHRDAESGPGAR